MKNLITLTMLFAILASCSGDLKENPIEQPHKFSRIFPQTWELVNEGGIAGEDPLWQESYLFAEDGTFLKSRTKDGVQSTATGTFEIVITSNTEYLSLQFITGEEIVNYCSSPSKEALKISSDYLQNTSWRACDGPILYYKEK